MSDDEDNHDLFNSLFVDTNYVKTVHTFRTTRPSKRLNQSINQSTPQIAHRKCPSDGRYDMSKIAPQIHPQQNITNDCDHSNNQSNNQSISPMTVEALHLQSATTSFDLTGQLTWPATHIVASFLMSELADPYWPSISQSIKQSINQTNNQSTCIELGAGAGVISLLLMKLRLIDRLFDRLVITDHNPVVLQLIEKNIKQTLDQSINQINQPIDQTISDSISIKQFGQRFSIYGADCLIGISYTKRFCL